MNEARRTTSVLRHAQLDSKVFVETLPLKSLGSLTFSDVLSLSSLSHTSPRWSLRSACPVSLLSHSFIESAAQRLQLTHHSLTRLKAPTNTLLTVCTTDLVVHAKFHSNLWLPMKSEIPEMCGLWGGRKQCQVIGPQPPICASTRHLGLHLPQGISCGESESMIPRNRPTNQWLAIWNCSLVRGKLEAIPSSASSSKLGTVLRLLPLILAGMHVTYRSLCMTHTGQMPLAEGISGDSKVLIAEF